MPRTGARFEKSENVLSSEELARLVRLFTELGVRRVRITGGEPLLRHGCSDETLKTMIRVAIANKPERHNFLAAGGEVLSIPMSALGG
jgi:hypothetical protein